MSHFPHRALAAAGVLFACTGLHAQSSLTLYGVVDAGVTYINNNAATSRITVDSGSWQSSRFGLRGMEDLGGGLKAEFVLEAGISVDTGAAVGTGGFNRQSFIGIGGDWGKLTLGRQYDFLYVNVLPLSSELFAGGLASGTAGSPGGTAGNTNILDVHFGGTRYNNSLKWVKPFGPVTVGLMHGFGLERTTPVNNRSVNSALLAYRDGPLAIGFAWTQDDFDAANSGNTANRVAAVKALYKTGALSFLVNYADATSRNSQATSKPLELGVAYSPAAPWLIGLALGRARVTNANGAATHVDQITLGATYQLSKRTTLYAMAARNRSADAAVYRGFVGAPGGATAPSSTAGQSALRTGITHLF